MTRRGSRARKGRKKKPKKGLRFWENLKQKPKPPENNVSQGELENVGRGINTIITKGLIKSAAKMNIPQMTPKKEEETK